MTNKNELLLKNIVNIINFENYILTESFLDLTNTNQQLKENTSINQTTTATKIPPTKYITDLIINNNEK